MAWDYAAQIHALTGFDADDIEGESETGDTYSVLANRWLTDAAKEVINILPPSLLKLCTSTSSFTSAAVGSEAETLNTGKVLSVFAGNYEARPISSNLKHRVNNSGSLEYATSTDPAFYIESNKINVLPASLSCKYEEVQYPAVSYNATSISVFPDEAEHLVVLRAAITAAEYKLAIEEDVDLYAPIITSLKAQYQEGINALKTGNTASPKKDIRIAQEGAR